MLLLYFAFLIEANGSYLYIGQSFPFCHSVSSCLRMGQGCIPSTSQVRVYLFLPVFFKVQLQIGKVKLDPPSRIRLPADKNLKLGQSCLVCPPIAQRRRDYKTNKVFEVLRLSFESWRLHVFASSINTRRTDKS